MSVFTLYVYKNRANAVDLTWVCCSGCLVSVRLFKSHLWDRVNGSSGNLLLSSLPHGLGCVLTGGSISPHIFNPVNQLTNLFPVALNESLWLTTCNVKIASVYVRCQITALNNLTFFSDSI